MAGRSRKSARDSRTRYSRRSSVSSRSGRTGTSSSYSSSSVSLQPKVEITVERLDGIIWSTPLRVSNRDELKKQVPFVTAAVEFSGTCPNMKVYSASQFPHSKHPAVESYFASLEDPKENQKSAHGGSEVKKIISTTTQENGRTTTTTTTTTVTTVQSSVTPVAKYKEGHHPLVAKWHDDSFDEKLVDSVTYFTSPQSCDEDDTRTLSTQGQKASKPHLTLTLPTAAEQRRPSIFESLFAPCHQHNQPLTSTSKRTHKEVSSTLTHSTCASTTCSSGHHNSQGGNSSSPFRDLGSLLDDQGIKKGCQKGSRTPITTRQEEADVTPVVATQKSKELAATAIAAERYSAVVGQTDSITPLSWMTSPCGTAAPEIVELRVRVMPEDSDEWDEMDPSKQHLAAAQDLEGVAHLVFLDQIIEEGTTIMDLPLKISHDKAMKRNPTFLSTTPAVGEQDFVTLGSNARLRVRVTILPQGKRQTAQQPHRLLPSFNHQPSLQHVTSMKTHALPETGLPFYSRPFSLRSTFYPLVERMFQSNFFL